MQRTLPHQTQRICTVNWKLQPTIFTQIHQLTPEIDRVVLRNDQINHVLTFTPMFDIIFKFLKRPNFVILLAYILILQT